MTILNTIFKGTLNLVPLPINLSEIKEIINLDACVHTLHTIKSTVSMGVIEVIQGESPVDAFKRVNTHLYKAKNTERNRVVS